MPASLVPQKFKRIWQCKMYMKGCHLLDYKMGSSFVRLVGDNQLMIMVSVGHGNKVPLHPFSLSVCSWICQNGGMLSEGNCSCVCVGGFSGANCKSELINCAEYTCIQICIAPINSTQLYMLHQVYVV